MKRLFHPLIFYPLLVVIAGLIILIGLEPQAWSRDPAPVAGEIVNGAIVLEGEAFDAPSPSPEQNMTVVRDFWGRAEALRIAVKPGQPEPTPAERGVRILLVPEQADMIEERDVVVEVSYNLLPLNTASLLAVSLQGIAPADWIYQEIPQQPGVLRFVLPAQFAVDAIGLRPLTGSTDQAYGLEITRIVITPSS